MSKRRKVAEMKHERGRARRSFLFLIPLVLGIAILGYVAIQPPRTASVGVGDIAPDFQLQVVGPNGLTGETVELSSLRGKVVFLQFMESWCHVCQQLAPAVESIRWDYEPRGVVFLSVAGTLDGANAESTAAFIKKYQTQWTYVLDSNNSVFSKYKVEATPTFFIVDRNGVIVNTFKGVITTEALTSALDSALAG
jgi:cytochrome c biogenesis protein CcmG/thiol:disulfide interchange protein DsbE